MFLQAFVVGRLVKYGGLSVAFFVLPVIALMDASLVAIIPALWILQVGKVAENATDYSINNTVRNMLWLPTTEDMKYKAKQAVDTFFVRMGDTSHAIVVLILAETLHFGVRAMAITNIILVGAWLYVAWAILREQDPLRERLKREAAEEEAADERPRRRSRRAVGARERPAEPFRRRRGHRSRPTPRISDGGLESRLERAECHGEGSRAASSAPNGTARAREPPAASSDGTVRAREPPAARSMER